MPCCPHEPALQTHPCLLTTAHPWRMLLMPPQGLSGHLLPAQRSCHVITGYCGSIWEIIPTPCLDGPSAHGQGRFIPRTLSQSWRGLHHLLPLACWVCFGQPGEFSSTEPSRCCSLTATLEKLSYPFLESRTQEDLNESVLLKELWDTIKSI